MHFSTLCSAMPYCVLHVAPLLYAADELIGIQWSLYVLWWASLYVLYSPADYVAIQVFMLLWFDQSLSTRP